ncbi:MAG: L-serine ammonia-lyase [Parachlamydiaceae bacterium]
MAISTFNLFSIGMGPSSSHTVGPMKAARLFVDFLQNSGILQQVARVKADLYGSLALTGKGHATDIAVMLGFSGETPEGIDPNTVSEKIKQMTGQKTLFLLGSQKVSFDQTKDLLFHYDKQLPYHPNGMRFTVYNQHGKEIVSQVYYSVGGGFIIDHETASKDKTLGDEEHKLPYPFKTADELLKLCRENNFTITQLMMENEKSWRSEQEVHDGILNIWKVMEACMQRGCQEEGILPGGLNVRRRAKSILSHLEEQKKKNKTHAAEVMEWVSLWALAVNEENAAGGRVVTAPTNGSAGVIPAVIKYYKEFIEDGNDEAIVTFMLNAGAIGILYKEGASISAAEMGCMGEVGVACSMAAAGLTAVLGGTNEQIENAAEIGMEHNLGLTCDPIKGLVQIPCIERNTMGAIKAINAALLALRGDGLHRVSLDQVIATMRATGHDMKAIYKETSLGGLAVNVPEC